MNECREANIRYDVGAGGLTIPVVGRDLLPGVERAACDVDFCRSRRGWKTRKKLVGIFTRLVRSSRVIAMMGVWWQCLASDVVKFLMMKWK